MPGTLKKLAIASAASVAIMGGRPTTARKVEVCRVVRDDLTRATATENNTATPFASCG